MPLVIIRSHNVTHIAQTPTTRGSRIGQRDVRVSGMATLKDRIDAICKELKVTVKEGGLIAQEAEEGGPQGPGDADAGSRAEEVGRALLLRHSLRQLL